MGNAEANADSIWDKNVYYVSLGLATISVKWKGELTHIQFNGLVVNDYVFSSLQFDLKEVTQSFANLKIKFNKVPHEDTLSIPEKFQKLVLSAKSPKL